MSKPIYEIRCVMCARLKGEHPDGHNPLWVREREEGPRRYEGAVVLKATSVEIRPHVPEPVVEPWVPRRDGAWTKKKK
jgi:hypothetical protein